MKKTLLMHAVTAAFGILLLGLQGCSDPDVPQPQPGQTDAGTKTASLTEQIVYHEATASWIRHANDPYALDNFQRAYDNLTSGNSAQTLSKDVARQVASVRIDATHYNVKIYPRTEEELWSLESMPDITLAYVPFDYEQLPQAQTAALDRADAKTVFPSEGKYTVTHQGYETVEGPQPDETFTLPAVYAVWPCDKPFPAGMDYRILYEVFLPGTNTNRARSISPLAEAMQALENEAIALARSDRPKTRIAIGEWIAQKVTGSAFHYDNTLRKEVPLHNLKVRFQIGSKVWETYTGADGSFRIDELVSAGAVISFRFQHEKWAITQEDSRILVTETMGVHYDQWKANKLIFRIDYENICYSIHRAINYYYFGSHGISRITYGNGIRIRAINESNTNASGYFHSSSKNEPLYITIYKNYFHSHLIGTTCHEIGHFIHYTLIGRQFWQFKDMNPLLKESYACYVGWRVGEAYYNSLGYKTFNTEDITLGKRQEWKQTNQVNGNYSPLFVDLADDYNQNETDLYYPMDVICNVPNSTITTIISGSTDWAACKRLMQGYVGIYYTQEELNIQVAPYDFYFSRFY